MDEALKELKKQTTLINKELARHLQKNKGPELEALLVYLMSIKAAGLSGAE